jgi:putative phosphoesterase
VRLALLSDIHGNPIALNAVLDDLAACGGADGFLILGDLVAIGHDPLAVLERLLQLPNARFIQGNTERYVVTGQRPYPSVEAAVRDTRLIGRLVEVAHSFAWTQGVITGGSWLEWLAALPLEQSFTLADGTRLLAVHVAPGQDDGLGIHPRLSDDELSDLVAEAGADLVCVGHTHWPVDRTVRGVRVVNAGSVSNPSALDLRASYALVESTPSGYQVEHRRVVYDVETVITAVEQSRHPAGAYIISHFRGERRPWWADGDDGRELIGATTRG